MFSLTDHDNMGGCTEAREAAIEFGLHFLHGWEVSSYENATKVHILGYGCHENEAYHAFIEGRRKGSVIRAKDMIKKANAYFGTNVSFEEVEAFHLRKFAPLHTMHVVKAFAQRLSMKRGEVYVRYFARGGPAFSEECRPTPEDAVEIIHKTGGIAVLAHPGRILDLSEEDLARFRASQDEDERAVLKKKSAIAREGLMDRLTDLGLDGIECIYTTHTFKETEYFLAYAKRRGLIVTGGSDFHAEGAQNVIGMPTFDMCEAVAKRLLRLEGSA